MIFQTKSRAIKFLEMQGCERLECNTKVFTKPGYFKVAKGCMTRPYYTPVKRGHTWRIYRNFYLINGVEMKEMVTQHDKI